MINSLLMGILKLIISLVNLLLKPIDLLIEQFIPSLADGLDKVSALFNWITNLVPWGVSWFGLETSVITLFVAYITFELTIPLLIHAVKLAIKWYDKLKP